MCILGLNTQVPRRRKERKRGKENEVQLVMVVPSYNLIILEADLRKAWVAEQTLSQPLPLQQECTFPLIEVLSQVWKFVFQTLL